MNKRLIIGLLSALVLATSYAQVNDWENHEITQINAEVAHASYVPFQQAAWQNNSLEESPLVRVLNGTWKFRYFENPGQVPRNIHRVADNGSGTTFRFPPTGNCRATEITIRRFSPTRCTLSSRTRPSCPKIITPRESIRKRSGFRPNRRTIKCLFTSPGYSRPCTFG